MTEIDAIVLDLDGGEALEALLDSLERQIQPFRRVVIWDNGSTVPVADRLRERALPITIGRSATNLGFTGGINAAMAMSEAPFVAWINNDVVLEPEWSARLREALRGERIAGAQSVILRTDGRIDGAGITIAGGLFRQEGHGEPLGRIEAREPWGVSGTAAMFRRDALADAAVGGAVLRPELFAYYEDVELAARLRARGWRFALVPEPLAIHRGSMTASRLPDADLLRVANRYRVARMHRGVGRRGAMLREDARRIAGALRHGRAALAGRIFRGALDGLFGIAP